MQQKKIELRASLIQELEHKKKVIENERNTMELTGGKCCELKHTSSLTANNIHVNMVVRNPFWYTSVVCVFSLPTTTTSIYLPFFQVNAGLPVSLWSSSISTCSGRNLWELVEWVYYWSDVLTTQLSVEF